MLRKYVLEASVLKVLRDAVPIVTDVDMTEGGLHRFHLNIAVSKRGPEHEGLQRNAALAAFGALKDLVRVVVTRRRHRHPLAAGRGVRDRDPL